MRNQQNAMRNIGRFTLLLLTCCTLNAVAQDAVQQVEEEHRYQFTVPSDLSTYTEKVLLEAISGFDPRMHVDIDRPINLMKVLAYQPIDPQAVVSLAAQYGVTITQRRTRLDPSPNISVNQ